MDKKEAHNKRMNHYRSKLKEDKKQVSFWIDQPICLRVLMKQSEMNQSKVLNILLESVSDAFDSEFHKTQEELEERIKNMVCQLRSFFQKRET